MRIIIALLLSMGMSFSWADNLSKTDIENWLSSAPELHDWLEQQEDKLQQAEELDASLDSQAAIAEAISKLQEIGIYDELTKRVKAAGFKDATHWFSVSQRVSLSYFALMMEDEMGRQQELEAQLKLIQQAEMPAEQKEVLGAMLESSLAILAQINDLPQADLDAVRPYLDQLHQLMNMEEDE